MKFSGTNPKTIVVLCRREGTPNHMLQKWSYDGTLLWASMNALTKLGHRYAFLDIDIDDQEFIYFTSRSPNSPGLEGHAVLYKLSPDGSSLSWVKHAASDFYGGLTGVFGNFVYFGGIIDTGTNKFATLLKLNREDGALVYFKEYKNDQNQDKIEVKGGNYGLVDSDGNVVLQTLFFRSG